MLMTIIALVIGAYLGIKSSMKETENTESSFDRACKSIVHTEKACQTTMPNNDIKRAKSKGDWFFNVNNH